MIRHLSQEPVSPERVVIIGGSGFIGKNLLRRLEQSSIEAVAVSSAQADLCDPESAQTLARLVRKGDTLVIAAAVTPDKGRDLRTQMKNLQMQQTLLSFFEKTSCSHVIYISSDAVYDEAVNPVREDSRCDPSSFYGLTHWVRERMLAEVLKPSQTPFLILRSSILYGIDDTHNSYGPNRFLRSAQSSRKISLFGNGEEKRDHVYIKDFCDLTALCLTHRSEGMLNVATGRSVSFMEVAQMIQGLFQGRLEIETTPRASAITHRHYDISATIRAFPVFQYTTLEKGLSEIVGAALQKA